MSLRKLGILVKSKYPEYSDMSDEEVGHKVFAKYPEYRDIAFEDDPYEGTTKPIFGKGEQFKFSEQDLASKVIPQLATGVAESLPMLKNVLPLPVPSEKMPDPKGVPAIVARSTGPALREIAQVSPFITGFGPVAGMGIYGGTKARLSGADTKETVKQFGLNALLGKAFHGISGVRAAPEAGKVAKSISTAKRIGLGGGLSAAMSEPSQNKDRRMADFIFGGAMTAKARPYTKGEISARATKLGTEGRDITEQIIQPRTKKGLDPGETYPEVETAYQNLPKEAKTYRDLIEQFKSKANEVGAEAESIVKGNNFATNPMEALKPLELAIKEAQKQGHQGAKIEGMIEVYKDELAKLRSGQIGNDRLSTHKRKQELQQLSAQEGTYAKGEMKADPKFTGRQEGLAAMARGYRAITEGGDKRLSQLNEQYGPLLEATNLSDTQLRKSIKSGDIRKKGFLNLIIRRTPYTAGSLVQRPAAAVTGVPIEASRLAQEQAQTLSSLIKRANKLRAGEQKLNPASKPRLEPPMQPPPIQMTPNIPAPIPGQGPRVTATGFTMPGQETPIKPAKTPPDIGNLEEVYYGPRRLPPGRSPNLLIEGPRQKMIGQETGFSNRDPIPEDYGLESVFRGERKANPVPQGKIKPSELDQLIAQLIRRRKQNFGGRL